MSRWRPLGSVCSGESRRQNDPSRRPQKCAAASPHPSSYGPSLQPAQSLCSSGFPGDRRSAPCASAPRPDRLPRLPRRPDDEGRQRPEHRCRRSEVLRQHSRQPECSDVPRRHQGISASRSRSRRWSARRATPTRQNQLMGSVHADGRSIPAPVATATRTPSFPKTDPRSAVYPLNVPRTCGTCHGNERRWPRSTACPASIRNYMDSIHGFALSKEGLLVAANCQSCHGSHHILSHNNPQSPTYKANIPKTCGTCHAKIDEDYRRRRARQGCCSGQDEGACLLGLPHRPRHPAAH